MTLRHREQHPIVRELRMRQLLVPRRHAGCKADIQSARQYGLNLMNRKLMMHHELHGRLTTAEFAERLRNHSVPGDSGRDSDSKRPRFGSGHELACQCTRARTKTCTVKRNTDVEATIVGKFVVMEPLLDERARRLWAAAESVAIGYGGDALVSAAPGVARETNRNGRREVAQGVEAAGRIRRPGGGRADIGEAQHGVAQAPEPL